MRSTILFFVISAVLFTGCAAHMTAGWDMENSKTKYTDCLKAYPNDESKCEGLRKIFEINKEAVEAVRGNNVNIRR